MCHEAIPGLGELQIRRQTGESVRQADRERHASIGTLERRGIELTAIRAQLSSASPRIHGPPYVQVLRYEMKGGPPPPGHV